MYFLRFTNNPLDDLNRNESYWNHDNFPMEEDPPYVARADKLRYNHEFGCWVEVHDGLCGFYLDADTIEEAIETVSRQKSWAYFSTDLDEWVIFEGSLSINQDTPEGQTFFASKIAYTP